MKSRSRSLRVDLLVDLSLITLCALLLSEALMIILLRREIPNELEAVASSQMKAIHESFVQSDAVGKSGNSLPESFKKFLEQKKWSEISSVVSLLSEDEIRGISGALADGSISVETGKFLGFIPYKRSFYYATTSPSGKFLVYRWSAHGFQDLLTRFKFHVFFITLFIEILLVLLAYHLLFRRNLLIPVAHLTDVARELRNENWAARFGLSRQDELGSIGDALNEMAQKIQEKEKKLVLTIESLKDANEELELRQNEHLQIEKLASIGRLAAGVAHEVGNPLGAISGYVDILRRSMKQLPGANKEDIDLCDRIETETNRISKIIRALLQQARPTKDRIRSVELKAVLVRCVQLAQIPSHIDVVYDFEDEGASVSAEEDQLVQVFLNLLVNAKHAIEGRKDRAEPGRLKIRCAQRKLPIYRGAPSEGSDYDTSMVRALKPEIYWVINIEDNGTGITDDDQKKLFEPFFSTKAPGKGTGLGLYVTKSIVESFRGAIVVRSAHGFGATFSVFLPKAKNSQDFIVG